MNPFKKHLRRRRSLRSSNHLFRHLRVEPLESRRVMAVIDWGTLGAIGVTIFGVEANDQSGVSVSSAGDVNGDGFDDLLIGARYADAAGNGKTSAGETYLVFGK